MSLYCPDFDNEWQDVEEVVHHKTSNQYLKEKIANEEMIRNHTLKEKASFDPNDFKTNIDLPDKKNTSKGWDPLRRKEASVRSALEAHAKNPDTGVKVDFSNDNKSKFRDLSSDQQKNAISKWEIEHEKAMTQGLDKLYNDYKQSLYNFQTKIIDPGAKQIQENQEKINHNQETINLLKSNLNPTKSNRTQIQELENQNQLLQHQNLELQTKMIQDLKYLDNKYDSDSTAFLKNHRTKVTQFTEDIKNTLNPMLDWEDIRDPDEERNEQRRQTILAEQEAERLNAQAEAEAEQRAEQAQAKLLQEQQEIYDLIKNIQKPSEEPAYQPSKQPEYQKPELPQDIQNFVRSLNNLKSPTVINRVTQNLEEKLATLKPEERNDLFLKLFEIPYAQRSKGEQAVLEAIAEINNQ